MTVFDSRSVSPGELVRVLLKRKWAIIGLFVSLLTGLSLYCFFWPPTYEARQRFLVKIDRDDPLVSPDQNTAIRTMSRARILEDDLNSEAAILRSEPVLRKTVIETGLDKLPPHWLLRIINIPFDAIGDVYDSWHNKPKPDAVTTAIERLAKKTEVMAEKKSAILNVSVRWGDPRAALILMEKLSANYLEQHLATHKGPETAKFFQEQADRKRQELAAIDRMIAAVSPGATLNGVEMERELSLRNAAEAEASWRRAKASEAETQARLRTTTEQLNAVPERVVKSERNVVNQTAIGGLKTRVLDLQIRRTELLRRYLPDHRLVKEVEEELSSAQRMLDSELSSPLKERTTEVSVIAESLQRDRSLTAAALTGNAALRSTLEKDIVELKTRAGRLKKDAVALAALEREKRWIEDSLLIYNKRVEEARALDAMNRMRIVNVVPVEPPTVGYSPVKPDAKLLFKLGLPLILLLAIGFGFALELMDPRVRSRADLEAELGVAVLAAVPPTARRRGA